MARKRHLPDGMSVISLRLPSEMHDRFKELAESEHRTVSQELRRLVAARVDHIEAKEAA